MTLIARTTQLKTNLSYTKTVRLYETARTTLQYAAIDTPVLAYQILLMRIDAGVGLQ